METAADYDSAFDALSNDRFEAVLAEIFCWESKPGSTP